MATISGITATKMNGISLGGGAESTAVNLPVTEATADANTFVCQMTAASGNETGVGGGLTGADLVLTDVGGVGAASAGYRAIDAVSKGFTSTTVFLDNFLLGEEWTWMFQIKDIAAYSAAAYVTLISSADGGRIQIARFGAGYQSFNYVNGAGNPPGGTFNGKPLDDGWVAIWGNASALCCGWNCATTPTRWEDFAADERCVFRRSDIVFTGHSFDSLQNVVGYAGSNYSDIFKIGTIVFSKLALGIPTTF